MLRGAWNDDLIEELRNFPNGTHDDQIDGCSDAFNELNEGNLGLLEHLEEQARLAEESQSKQDTAQSWLDLMEK